MYVALGAKPQEGNYPEGDFSLEGTMRGSRGRLQMKSTGNIMNREDRDEFRNGPGFNQRESGKKTGLPSRMSTKFHGTT